MGIYIPIFGYIWLIGSTIGSVVLDIPLEAMERTIPASGFEYQTQPFGLGL